VLEIERARYLERDMTMDQGVETRAKPTLEILLDLPLRIGEEEPLRAERVPPLVRLHEVARPPCGFARLIG